MDCDQTVTGLTGKLMAFTEELKLWRREMEEICFWKMKTLDFLT